jgi:hypothetical protein
LLAFSTGGTERAQFDASGRLLVGTSSTSGNATLHVNKGSSLGTDAGGLLLTNLAAFSSIGAGDDIGYINFGASTTGAVASYDAARILCEADATWGSGDYPTRLSFYTTVDGASSATERMRLGSNGMLYLGTTSTLSTIANARLQVRGSNAAVFLGDSGIAAQQVLYIHHNNTSGNNLFMEFGTEGVVSTRGSVDYNRAAGQVRYNVTSDRRLKSDIQPASTALNALSAIQVRSYKWAETGYQIDHGFIAQELNDVAPDAVKVGDDGDEVTDTWAVDNGKLVPLLTKALQEAIAKIETLETRLTALEVTP